MLINENGKLTNDERFRVTLRNGHSQILIECNDFETFESLVDITSTILDKEKSKKENK